MKLGFRALSFFSVMCSSARGSGHREITDGPCEAERLMCSRGQPEFASKVNVIFFCVSGVGEGMYQTGYTTTTVVGGGLVLYEGGNESRKYSIPGCKLTLVS